MIVHITQKHIDEGVPGSSTGCALALALKESGLAPAGQVLVGEQVIWLGKYSTYHLPLSCMLAMRLFDKELGAKPWDLNTDELSCGLPFAARTEE